MHSRNLRNIDLNLLPILDVLLDERSVTLTSNRIHLSQSATSSALRRLRETFNDPILVRHGQRMVPSAKALLIRDELKQALSSVSDVVGALRLEALNEENRTVALTAPEYVHLAMANALRGIIRDKNRSINLNVSTFNRKTALKQLEQGIVDIALGAFGHLDSNLKRTPLYREDLIVSMRNDHPVLSKNKNGRMRLDDFLHYPHLAITKSDLLEEAWVSRWLSAKSLKRNVSTVINTISLAPEVLKNTDLICVGAKRTVDMMPEGQTSLAVLKLPEELGMDSYDIEMIWHKRTDTDEALKSVREKFVSACKNMT